MSAGGLLDSISRAREPNHWIVFFERRASSGSAFKRVIFRSPHLDTNLCVEPEGLKHLAELKEAFLKLPSLLAGAILHKTPDDFGRSSKKEIYFLRTWLDATLAPLTDNIIGVENDCGDNTDNLKGFGYCFIRRTSIELPEHIAQYDFFGDHKFSFTDLLHEWETQLRRLDLVLINEDRFRAACTALGLLCSIDVYLDALDLAATFASQVVSDNSAAQIGKRALDWIHLGAHRREEKSLDVLFCSALRTTL